MAPSADHAPDTDASARLASERTDYRAGRLTDAEPADPMPLFDAWLAEAFARRADHGDLAEPTAVVLSTVELTDAGPQPRSRTVLLKGHDANGFVVYTNLRSAKGRQALASPAGAMLLPWYALQRQVRIEGRLEQVEDALADAYFASRPRGSQLGAWASRQSEPIASRAALEAAYAEVEARFAGEPVPRPAHWGGLRLVPERIEFWQGGGSRLHDRIVYERAPEGGWTHRRLQP
ncbi:pyridoxamine 5'-phosphate oxidase [Brachybacterium hainanense]|uniref:Pyridoxine/pyridoxamine 5'-phosphate oxidase n=1 Tax=Brachybacterium hainanense TaxID=1541174 RepID=A0ABV6R6A5_9MICO